MCRGLSFGLSPCELSCMCLDWMLVRGISLPAAQLFVIAMENILRVCGCVWVCVGVCVCVCVGNPTSSNDLIVF